MLLSVNPLPISNYSSQLPPEQEYISLRDVIEFLRENSLLIGMCVIAFTVIGATYALTTPPTYTAEARLIIDTSQSRLLLQEPNSSSLAMESALVDSEVELVKSRAIALAVIERLELVDEAEYNEKPGFLTKIRRWVKSTFSDTSSIDGNEIDAKLRRAMGAYAARLGVRRLGESYVLEISYSSRSAPRAAEITNAIADAYIETKIESKAEGARRGAAWLEDRLEELGRQANRAAAEVEKFKASQRIIKSTTDGSLAERELRDTSAQLLQARGEATRLRARLDAVDAMLASGELNDVAAADVGENTILTMLRQRMVDARMRHAEIVLRYGTAGPAPSAANSEIEQIRSEIRAELLRVRAVYRVNLDAAELNRSSTGGTFNEMLNSAAEASGQYVRLAELESRASTFRRMYETMLQHFTQTVQRESYPVSDARVVTPAVQPFSPSEPKTTLIVGLSLIVGSAMGVGLAVGRNALANGISSARDVERRIGVPCVAELPGGGEVMRLRSLLFGDVGLGREELTTVLASPHSDFARALTTAKVSLDIALKQKRPLLVGITSVEANARHSRIAANLAFLYAAEGSSTLLLDADGKRSALTEAFRGGHADVDVDVDADADADGDADSDGDADGDAGTDPDRFVFRGAINPLPSVLRPSLPVAVLEDGLHFASIVDRRQASPHRALAILRQYLSEVTSLYDVIVLDLPPMGETSDTRALWPNLDSLLVRCEHLRTSVDDLANAVASLGPVSGRFVGVIIDGATRRGRNV